MKNFTSGKNSSVRPCFHKIMRQLRALELHPFASDLLLGSSRCGRIIAAFIAMLKVVVPSTNDSSCSFSNSMNWKLGLFLIKTMKRGFHLTTFLFMSFILSFQESEGTVVIAGTID